MNKKIFTISTLALVLLVGAIFVYNFAFKKPTSPVTAPKIVEEGKSSDLPATNQSTPKQASDAIAAISDGKVFGATLAPGGNTIYLFANENGQLNQVDFNGKLQKVISTEKFEGIQGILWNKLKNRVIVRRENVPGKSKFLLLDLTQKTVVPLKDDIDSVAWSGLGDKIIYKYYDSRTRKREISISDPNGSNWRKLTDMGYFNVEISAIPGSSDISFWPSPDAFVSSLVNLVGFSGENRKELLKDRFGVDLLWSPDGKTAAVSSTDQKGGKKTALAVMNSDGGQFRSLDFPTFAKKCTWSADSKFLFCAMPGNIPESSILPNDWQKGVVQTTDTFWKIEIATGKKDRLVEADKINGSFDVLNPFLSQDEKTLFFVNKADGKLYKLEL